MSQSLATSTIPFTFITPDCLHDASDDTLVCFPVGVTSARPQCRGESLSVVVCVETNGKQKVVTFSQASGTFVAAATINSVPTETSLGWAGQYLSLRVWAVGTYPLSQQLQLTHSAEERLQFHSNGRRFRLLFVDSILCFLPDQLTFTFSAKPTRFCHHLPIMSLL